MKLLKIINYIYNDFTVQVYGCHSDCCYSGGRGVFTMMVGKVLIVPLALAVGDSSLSQSGVETTMLGVATHPW